MADKQPTVGKLRFDTPLQELYLNLWRTYDRLRELEENLFSQYDLNSQQYNVLRVLKAAQPGAMATLALADRLVSRSPDITRLLDRLVERGLVERIRSAEDRRQVLARITPEGVKLLHTIAGPLAKCHERQLGHLSADEVQSLIELLQAARRPHELPTSNWL